MDLPQTTRVRKATAEDLNAIVDTLARAFEVDPVAKWVTLKPTYPRYFFDVMIPSFLEHKHTYIAEDGAGGLACLPPGVELQSPMSPGVMWTGLTEYGPRALLRAFALLVKTQKHRPKAAYHYLFAIGTERAQRGRGVGSALMRQVLAQCDDEGMPAYLENSNVKNLPFYRKHGFDVLEELQLGKNGPALSLMRREPRW